MHRNHDPHIRAAEFTRSRSLVATYRRPLAQEQISHLTRQAESLLQLAAARQSNAYPQGLSVLRRVGSPEIQAHYSGNSEQGSLVLKSGHHEFTQVQFQKHAITIFQTSTSNYGSFAVDSAVVLDRRRPQASVMFGRAPQLETLLAL